MKLLKWSLPLVLSLVILITSNISTQAEEDTAVVFLKANIVLPPAVITNTDIGAGTTRATLRGYLSSMGTASSANVSFGWDTQPHPDNPDAYANWTPEVTMTSEGKFKYRITDLQRNTTYYFRARAIGDSTAYGEELSFTTHPDGPWWDWLEWLTSTFSE
ncbi:fibronectin type III domain-containing protein [Chloroflexota bacterium]